MTPAQKKLPEGRIKSDQPGWPLGPTGCNGRFWPLNAFLIFQSVISRY
jgi:hypothetical protein